MEIIEVNGKKYITQIPVSAIFRPITPEIPEIKANIQITASKPIDIINPIKPIKPIFVCNGQCGKCIGKKCYTI